jgi:hypothetical protein
LPITQKTVVTIKNTNRVGLKGEVKEHFAPKFFLGIPPVRGIDKTGFNRVLEIL